MKTVLFAEAQHKKKKSCFIRFFYQGRIVGILYRNSIQRSCFSGISRDF